MAQRTGVARRPTETLIKDHMMSEQTQNIEAEIEAATAALAQRIAEMSTNGFIREGIIKATITNLVWDIYDAMPDCRDGLIEALDEWEPSIRGRMEKESSLKPEPEN